VTGRTPGAPADPGRAAPRVPRGAPRPREGVRAIRATTRQPAAVGYAPVGLVVIPDERANRGARARAPPDLSMREPTVWTNSWWMDPVFFGQYPEDGLALFGRRRAVDPRGGPGDDPTAPRLLRVNSYMATRLPPGHAPGAPTTAGRRGTRAPAPTGRHPGDPPTGDARFFHERYGLPSSSRRTASLVATGSASTGGPRDPARID
jgi:beta-glucosidase